MKKMKKLIVFILFIISLNFALGIIFFEVASASTGYECIEKSMSVSLTYKGSELKHTSNEIYYVNNVVDVLLPDKPCPKEEEDEIINGVVTTLSNTYPANEIHYLSEDKLKKAVYDGTEFSEYIEMSGRKDEISCDEAVDYKKNIIKYEITRSYKFYIGEDKENIIYMVDIIYDSPVYQFITDKKIPSISINDENVELGVVDAYDVRTVNISDETGISLIEVKANNNVIDTITVDDAKRITSYEYDVLLTDEYGDKCSVNITVRDISGNENTFSFSYELDTKKPEVYIHGVNDGGIYKDGVSLNAKAYDNRGKVYLYLRCMFTDMNGNEKCIEEETLESDKELNINKNYSEEGIYDISIYAYDANSNYSDVLTCCFAVDSHAPTVSFENIENGKIYNQNVTVYALVKENFFENMNVSVSMELEDETGNDINKSLIYDARSRLNKNLYTFSANGKYRLLINAQDALGHSSFTECFFTIDREAPLIEILYEEDEELTEATVNKGQRQVMFNKKPELIVKTSDVFSRCESCIALYKRNDNDELKSVYEKIVNNDNKSEINVPVNSEGIYELRVMANDEAGNSSIKSIEFTIDETPPVIGYINDFNEKYLKSFKLPNHLDVFLDDLTEVSYKAYLNSNEVGSLDLNKDGKYILQIVATDEADNKSEEMIAFIVDGSAPKLIVNGIDSSGKVENDGLIKLSLFDEDDYFSKVTVNGKKQKLDNGGRVVNIDAKVYGDMTISVEARDFAGNTINKEIKATCGTIGNKALNDVKASVDDRLEETLPKNDEKIRETFFDKITGVKFVVFSAFVFTMAVAFIVFAFVDMLKNKG